MMNPGSGIARAAPPDLSAEVHETISQRIEANAEERPAALAIHCLEETISWGELGRRVMSLARGLQALGIRPGERIGILADNSIEYVLSILAVVRAGAVVVPLPLMVSDTALRQLVEDSDVRAAFVSERHLNTASGAIGAMRVPIAESRLALDFERAGWLSLSVIERRGSTVPALPQPPMDSPFNIIYSSGTTGIPKGIVQSHRLRSVQSAGFGRLGCDRDTRTLISTPLYANFSFGATLVTLWGGGAVWMLPRFREIDYLEACRVAQPSHTFIVPVQIARLLRHPDFDRSVQGSPMLKYSSGSPLRLETKREVLQRWPGPLVEVYGMTEGGAVTALFAAQHPDKLGSVGTVVGGGEIVIIGADGRPAPHGTIGEIAGTAGPVMAGYNNQPQASAELLWAAPNGRQYLRSGDLGYLDADGFLYLTGRRKDLIISGGLNIYAIDLEDVLALHPAVAEVAVIAVPSDRFGEAPLALVVLRSDQRATPAELLTWANGRLGKAQRLSAVELRDTLPRGPIGKVLKDELRRPYWANESAQPIGGAATSAMTGLASAESQSAADKPR